MECWNCQKNNACATLYLNGEQQTCPERARAYTSIENYIAWLAKGDNYNDEWKRLKQSIRSD